MSKKVVEILIYDAIYPPGWGYCDAKTFAAELRAAEAANADSILIRINSPGGMVSEAMAIFNLIQSSAKYDIIDVVVDGCACSAAALLSLAGKRLPSAGENAMIMYHSASNFCWGNAKDMRDCADVLDKFDGTIAQTIAAKTGKSIDDVKASLMNYTDNWLTAAEAKDAGLVGDVITITNEVKMPDNVKNMDMGAVMAFYNNLKKGDEKKGFIESLAGMVKNLLKTDKTIIENKNNDDMKNLTAYKAVENKSAAEITADETAAITAELAESGVKNVEVNVVGALAAATKKAEDAEAELATAKAALTEKETAIATAATEKKAAEDALAIATAEVERLGKIVPGAANRNTVKTGADGGAVENSYVNPDAEHNKAADALLAASN